jgi:hypothetical protein
VKTDVFSCNQDAEGPFLEAARRFDDRLFAVASAMAGQLSMSIMPMLTILGCPYFHSFCQSLIDALIDDRWPLTATPMAVDTGLN